MTYRESPRPCPECGTELVAFAANRAKWRCTTCGGILVGGEELERELGSDLILDTITGVRATRPCPLCHEPMTAYRLSTIEIDRCAKDGAIWFDRGELGRARRESSGAVSIFEKLDAD